MFEEGPAVFWRLDELALEDGIELESTRGERLHYEVVSSDIFDRQSAPISEIVGETGGEHLTVLTAAEPYDESTGEYERILVVRAERIEDDSADESAPALAGTPVTVERCRE
jgi:hypothetical protein